MKFVIQHMSEDDLNEKDAFRKLKENFARNILDGVLDYAFSDIVEYDGDGFIMYNIKFEEPKKFFVYEFIDKESVNLASLPKNGLYTVEIFNECYTYTRKLQNPEKYGLKLVTSWS